MSACVVLLRQARVLGASAIAFLHTHGFEAFVSDSFFAGVLVLLDILVLSAMGAHRLEKRGLRVRTPFGPRTIRWQDVLGIHTGLPRLGPLENVILLRIDTTHLRTWLDPRVFEEGTSGSTFPRTI